MPLPHVKAANQREQPSRRIEIEIDFFMQALTKDFRSFVVHRAPRHIYRFDLRRRRIADGVIVALTQHEVIFDYPPEWRHRKVHLANRVAAFATNIEHQAILDMTKVKLERAFPRADGLEEIFFNEIINRDFALMFDIRRRARKAALVERYSNNLLPALMFPVARRLNLPRCNPIVCSVVGRA